MLLPISGRGRLDGHVMHSLPLYAMTHTPDPSQYIPGTCNLGQEETNRRWRIGYLGTAIALIMILLIELTNQPQWTRLLIFIPVYYALSGYLQARQKFCYLYGLRGVFSVAGRQQFGKVEDEAAMQKDRQLVYSLIAKILAGTILITAIYYFLPKLF